MSLRTRLILSFLFIALLPLTVSSVLQYRLARQALIESSLEHLSSSAGHFDDAVSAIARGNLDKFHLIASRTQLRVELRDYHRDGETRRLDYARRILADASGVVEGITGIFCETPDRARKLLEVTREGAAMTPAEDDAIPADRVSVSLRISPDSPGYFRVSGPLYLEGVSVGLLHVLMDPFEIEGVISSRNAPLGETGEILLAERTPDGDARFLVPTRFRDHSRARAIIPAGDHHVPVTQAMAGREILIHTDEVRDYRDEPVLAVTRYLDDLDWGLVYKIDRAEALAPARNLGLVTLLVFSLTGLAGLAVAVLIASTISGPVRNLTRFVSRVRRGETDAVMSSSLVEQQDEIGLLARSFFQLTRELLESNFHLDRKVRERTAELRRSNQELDQFAYVASHDLKAPLRALDNLSQWIVEDVGDQLPESSRAHLEKMRARVHRMEALLEDLLAYSRVGRHPGMVESLSTRELVEQLVELVSPPEGFRVEVATELPEVKSFRAPLELVFRNLIANAIRHHDREDGRIEISSRIERDRVRFTVRDDGPGIDPVYHEKIFQMFQSLRPRDDHDSSGMGLALVKKIVESLGGTIEVESEPGEGATFSFTWPLEIEVVEEATA